MADVSKSMLKTVYDALDEKKGYEITVIDIHEISTIADYYVITHGTSSSQVQALVDNVQEKMGKAGFHCSVEGMREARWVLMDYQDVVVNVFSRDDRSWFDLERIWRDGRFIKADEIAGYAEAE